MQDDPRIDPLGRAAILTDTQLRVAFAPRDPKERVIGFGVEVRKTQMYQLAGMMKLGSFHVQLKTGFEDERHYEFKPEEVPMLMDALDKIITELPAAQRAKPLKGNDDD